MCNYLVLLTILLITPTYQHMVSSEQSEVLDSSEDYPTDCKAVLEQRYNTSGFYYIQPKNAPEPFLVWCNMESSGGGWTTILNRVDGSQDFYLDWDSYKEGFGNIADEFWLGLEKIHYMAGYETVELLFELVDWDDVQADAHYDYFGIGNEEEGYSLKLLQGFSGLAGDAFSDQASMKFSTRDKDQDVAPDMNCAETSRGGWWFRYCKSGNPTGEYADNGDGTADNYYACMFWETWHPFEYCLKEIRMMIRPKV